MARSARVGFLQFCLFIAVLAILARSAQLQLVEGEHHAARAERARTIRGALPAARGTIFDRGGVPLAETQESYHVSLAPEQVPDRSALARHIARALGENAATVERRLRRERSVYFDGPFSALQVQPIRNLRGVHLEPVYPRARPHGNLAQRTIGLIDPQSAAGVSGIEATLDSVLAGVPGEAVWLRHGGRGDQRYESPSRLVREPVSGNHVVLTIDSRLQEIAEAALDEAITRMDAKGGDVVFLDPNSGEVLAVASRVVGEKSSASAFTSPFEPGSTAKLFTAAALLSRGLVDSSDTVDGENGEWIYETAHGATRRITDTHAATMPLTLALAIERSSNIGMAKFSRRLTPEALYETFRDFGFGTRTGVEVAAEDDGGLPRPNRWKKGYDHESIAYGYAFQVTALQLAAAYAVIANGGVLYTPALVREVRAPDQTTLYRHRPEPVRRVLAPEVAAKLRSYLTGAVSATGTGERAQLQSYQLAGKTGTARKVVNGHYVNRYQSSFAAIWPIDRPQLVAIVTIDEPEGGYYGGETAAPLTKSILEEAITSRNRALDFNQLALRGSGVKTARRQPSAIEEPAPMLVAVPWPNGAPEPATAPLPVPDVAGGSVRTATATLHARGFRVAIEGSGIPVSTRPEAGSRAAPGSTITIVAEPARTR